MMVLLQWALINVLLMASQIEDIEKPIPTLKDPKLSTIFQKEFISLRKTAKRDR